MRPGSTHRTHPTVVRIKVRMMSKGTYFPKKLIKFYLRKINETVNGAKAVYYILINFTNL